ncbi:MAG: hypothetical protein ACRDF0_07695, partial [Candidatus Limnocylindria bacterium]
MANTNVLVRPAGTSWGAILGGWIASIGVAALLAPAVAALIAGRPADPNDLALAVPAVVGVLLAYLIGGYVAGRMAGYRTSWHGMLTAFFGLFVLLVVLALGIAANQGALAGQGIRSLGDVIPALAGFNIQNIGEALTFGGILGFLAAIFGGWLGGLLAPDHYLRAVTAAPTQPMAGPVAERRVVETRDARREG